MRTETSPGVRTRGYDTLDPADKQGFSSQQYPEKYNSDNLVDSLTIDYLRAASRERPDLIEHAHRVYGLVKAFAGDLMPDTRDAIMMHDIVSRFRNPDGKYSQESRDAAGIALLRYFTDPRIPHDKSRYMRDILSDFDEIEVAAGRHRKTLADETAASLPDENNRRKDIASVISDRYEGVVPREAWAVSEARIDPEYMKDFLQTVNVESVIIKACELIDNLEHPVSNRESALLQDVLEAESFYAPLCEVLGLEALGSKLLGLAKRIRLEKLNKFASIEQARDMLFNIKTVGVRRILENIFGDKYDVSLVVGPDYSGECPAVVGEFAAQLPSGRLTSGNYRVKSVGSLADKSDRDNDNMPMDPFAMMDISPDLESSAKNFTEIVQILSALPNVELQKAASKQSAIYVQGASDYVQTMTQTLAEAGIDKSQIHIKEQTKADIEKKGYKKMEVSKVTFIARQEHPYKPGETINIPIEFQFLTKDERQRSRTGDIAHIAYKYIDTKLKKEGYYELPDDNPKKKELDEEARKMRKLFVGVLNDIHDRMSRLNPDSYETNGQSDEGGEKLFHELEHLLQELDIIEL